MTLPELSTESRKSLEAAAEYFDPPEEVLRLYDYYRALAVEAPNWQDQAIAWLREHEHDESLDGEVTCNCGDFNTEASVPTIDSICAALAASKGEK